MRSLLAAIALPGMVAGYLPWRFFGLNRVRFHWSYPTHVIAVFLIMGGALLLAVCIWEFAARGRGTLAPVDPPKELVVSGLYRYVRNPMYVGVVTVLLGELLLVRNRGMLLFATCCFVMFNLFVMGYEEPYLRRRFGASYDAYVKQVGRWLPGRRYRPAG